MKYVCFCDKEKKEDLLKLILQIKLSKIPIFELEYIGKNYCNNCQSHIFYYLKKRKDIMIFKKDIFIKKAIGKLIYEG